MADGGQLTIEPNYGVNLSGGIVESGGTITLVNNYGTHAFTDFTLASGATLVELYGATETGLTIAPGATVVSASIGLFVGKPVGYPYPQAVPAFLLSATNTLAGTTVSAYDYLQETSGGSVHALTVDPNGRAYVFGGTLVGARIGGLLVVDGGAVSKIAVGNGGSLDLQSGTARGVTLASGATETVQRAQAFLTVVSGGAVQQVYSGAAGLTVVLAGGVQELTGGGALADGTRIGSGGDVIVTHGTLTDAVLAQGGTIDLRYASYSAGATATIDSADVLTIAEGGFFNYHYTLQLAGNYTGETFAITDDGRGGSLITLSAAGAVTHATDRVPAGGFAILSAGPPSPPAGPAGGLGGSTLPAEPPLLLLLPHLV